MKTKLEIIQETFEAYKDASKRGRDSNGNCVYLTNDGKMCAFGRCEINPPSEDSGQGGTVYDRFDEAVDLGCNEDEYIAAIDKVIDEALKPEYRGHKSEFWGEIQTLHDNDNYFSDDTWNSSGLEVIEKLKEKYAEN